MSHYAEYDYLIVNDKFDIALAQLCAVVEAQRLTHIRQQHQLQTLLASLLTN